MARVQDCFVIFFAALIPTVFAFNCSIPPIYSDIHKRAVHGSDIFQYGSFIGVGTPAQNQSIWSSLRHNVTSFASSDFCSNSSLTDCIDSTGGNVQYNESSTWQQSTYTSADQQSLAVSEVNGTDTLHIYTHYFEINPAIGTNVSDAPVQFANSGNINPGVVGLGSSSTIMQRLVDLGLAAARTHGLYIGTGMDRAGGVINGSNTWGGYDSGRFKGPVHTYDMDLDNMDALPVTVSNILLDDPANPSIRNVSLMDSETPFTARITTDQYPLSLPYGITQNFISMLSAVPSNSSDSSLQLSNPFNGTMTIVLSDGFNITLPASTMYNSSGLTPIAAQDDQNSTGPFYLSTAYLSQVYLMLDYESAKFHLAQAILENAYVIPVAFCPGSTPVPYNYDKKISTFLAKGLIGAVIGGVIGGTALLTLVVVVFVSWRNNKRNQRLERRWANEKIAIGKRRTNSDDSMDMEMSPLREKNYGPALLPPASYSARPVYAPVPLPSPYSSAQADADRLERAASVVSSVESEGEDGDSGSMRAPSSLSRHSR